MSAEERRRQSETIGQALDQYVAQNDFQGVLGDWIAFGSVVRVDEEGDPDCQYFVVMANGSMLQHVALGLMVKCRDVLEGGDPVD